MNDQKQKPEQGAFIKEERIMVNVWGEQTEVCLTRWAEIKKLGFEKHDRAFGRLNDRTPALFFGRRNAEREMEWWITTEKLEELE